MEKQLKALETALQPFPRSNAVGVALNAVADCIFELSGKSTETEATIAETAVTEEVVEEAKPAAKGSK